jgi:hypothetical protein
MVAEKIKDFPLNENDLSFLLEMEDRLEKQKNLNIIIPLLIQSYAVN